MSGSAHSSTSAGGGTGGREENYGIEFAKCGTFLKTLYQIWSQSPSKDFISRDRPPPLTFTGLLVHLQAVSSRAGAVKAHLQIGALMGAAAISGQTLIFVCGDAYTQS